MTSKLFVCVINHLWDLLALETLHLIYKKRWYRHLEKQAYLLNNITPLFRTREAGSNINKEMFQLFHNHGC